MKQSNQLQPEMPRLRVFDTHYPRRRLILEQDFALDSFQKKFCRLGSSLVNGVQLWETFTMPCPGGVIATMCSA